MSGPSFEDRTDFENADRGFIATLDPCTITGADAGVVWDMQAYAYLDGPCPETVNPSLWRQAQLCAKNGLYEVTAGIYQVRGFDLSNMTIVEGDEGVTVIDPLISAECAAAGLALYRTHRGDRPVTGVIYTHSHADHFGGVEGVLPDGADVPILAPEGFLEHAVSENVYAGGAMNRRAAYMYGSMLAPGVEGPDHRALCMAENATHNLHNLLTLRGALVRDPRVWSRYLDEAIELFTAEAEVAFASHHWPTLGREHIVGFLAEQRDLYAYLHDQTLRMLNNGAVGLEVAEDFELPPALESAWHARGYYGSVSHNVKAIYQRYLGWFDGNPSSLWAHPPEAAATRYVETIGGRDAVVEKARGYAADGDLRFAAELLKHAVFADAGDKEAATELAGVYEKLGFGSENATWRNFYLTGARELRQGAEPPPIADLGVGMIGALTVEQLVDSLAIRVDGPRAAAQALVVDLVFTDLGHTYRLTLSNGALIQTPNPARGVDVDLTLTLTKAQFLGLLAGHGLDGIEHSGDPAVLERLLGLLDTPDPAFPIVTP